MLLKLKENKMGIIDDINKLHQIGLRNGVEYKTLRINRELLDKLEAEINGFVQPATLDNSIVTLFGMKVEPVEDADYCYILED